jgi:hypothetical protein
MRDWTAAEAEETAAFIERLSHDLESQCSRAGGWPPRLRLPTPQTDAEQEGLKLWLAELQQATGTPIQIDFVDRLKNTKP